MQYHFVTRWKVKGTTSQVYAVLSDAVGYPRWWGECYVTVEEIRPHDKNGLDGLFRIVNRGKLPYTLEWYSSVETHDPPNGFTIKATGELEGKGTWMFLQEDEYVDITFLWDVELKKSWLKYFQFILKPILISNHNWVMERGETNLQKELNRVQGLIA